MGQGPQAVVERVLAKVWAELCDLGQFLVLFGHFCQFRDERTWTTRVSTSFGSGDSRNHHCHKPLSFTHNFRQGAQVPKPGRGP